MRHQPARPALPRWTILRPNNQGRIPCSTHSKRRRAPLLAGPASDWRWRRPPRRRTGPGSTRQLLAAAKKEGALVVYGSMNEEEALPYYKIFDRRDRHQGQLRARLRHRRHRPHRGRIPRQAEHVGRGDDDAGEPAARRRAGADRSAGGQGPHSAGARSEPALVRRLRQLQLARLQHQVRQARAAAEDLRGFPEEEGVARQGRDRQGRHRMADGDVHSTTARTRAASSCRTSSRPCSRW